MDRRCTRRSALAALGSVAIAGCFGDDAESFWADPPSFDDDGLDATTDAPRPERPDPVPVSVDDERREQVASRVETLLAPIPEPLDAEVLPNGAIRTEIVDARRGARDAVERMRQSPYTLETATAATDAAGRAARAAAVWAHVSADRTAGDLPIDRDEARDAYQRLSDAVPDVAAGTAEGVAVYAPIEALLRDAPPRAADSGENDPLDTGEEVARVERRRAEVATSAHLRDRYVETLAEPRAIDAALGRALDDLAPVTKTRFEELGGETVRVYWRPPHVEDYVSRDLPSGAPGARLLRERLESFPHGWSRPIAWPEREVEWPAVTLRNTHSALAHVEAFEAIRSRLEGGERLFPDDVAALEAARDDAIDAVATLVDADHHFDRWQAWELVPELASADENVESTDEAVATEDDRRTIAESYTTYVWVATFGERVQDATATVEDALGG